MPTYELLMSKLKAGVQHSVRDFFFFPQQEHLLERHTRGDVRLVAAPPRALARIQAVTTAGPRWLPIHRGEEETHSRTLTRGGERETRVTQGGKSESTHSPEMDVLWGAVGSSSVRCPWGRAMSPCNHLAYVI